MNPNPAWRVPYVELAKLQRAIKGRRLRKLPAAHRWSQRDEWLLAVAPAPGLCIVIDRIHGPLRQHVRMCDLCRTHKHPWWIVTIGTRAQLAVCWDGDNVWLICTRCTIKLAQPQMIREKLAWHLLTQT